MRRVRLLSLMYHDVAGPEDVSGFRARSAGAYRLSLPQFIAQLDAMEKGPLRPRTVIDLPPGGDAMLLTFDDGGESAMRVSELLDARGWKGHFFVSTAFIGTPGFVARSDILDMHRRGHVIGSHSHTHPNICYNLSCGEMLAEWRTSGALLAEIISAPVTSASVPGGDMDRWTVATAAEAGITHLFTSEPTFTPWRESGITCLGRVCVKRETSQTDIERFLRFRGFAKQMAIRRSKQIVKRLLSPVYRRRIARSYGDAPQGGGGR